MTVSTVFATAPGGAGNVSSISLSYATARSGGTLAAEANHEVGQAKDGANYICWEAFLIFTTSGIPDGDDITVATLTTDGNANNSDTDFTQTAATSTYNGGAVVTGDWVAGASLGALTALASFASAGYSVDDNVFTSVAAFLTAINKTGTTPIILFSNEQRDNSAPTAYEFVTWTDADAAGTTSDAFLTITHTTPPGGDGTDMSWPLTNQPVRFRRAAIGY